MVFQDATDPVDEAANLLGGRIRAEAKDLLPAQVTFSANVLRIEPGHLVIRDADHVPAGIANSCRSQPNRLYSALVTLDADEITHLKGAIEENHEAAEKISQRVLCGQRHGQTAHADPGDERSQRHAQISSSLEHRDERTGNAHGPNDQLSQMCVQLAQLEPR